MGWPRATCSGRALALPGREVQLFRPGSVTSKMVQNRTFPKTVCEEMTDTSQVLSTWLPPLSWPR